MTPQTGNPVANGRYLVWVDGTAGWLTPFITLWHDGKWCYRESTSRYPGKIHCWVGPIPAVHEKDLREEPQPGQEFDL